MISSTASDLMNRPTVMWSPWAMEEKIDDEVAIAMERGDTAPYEAKTAGEAVFLQIVWRLLSGYEFQVVEKEGTELQLEFKSFGRMSGREEFTERRLRMGRSRFLLYRKLMLEGKDPW